MKLRILTAAAISVALLSPAQARHYKPHYDTCVDTNVMEPCYMKQLFGFRAQAPIHVEPYRAPHKAVERVSYDRGAVIGGRPAGCPHAFCGCGASLYLFGRIKADLNLAANWLHFSRAAPAPRMAAARPGHVMVLVEHRHGDVWLVHDSNSGGGLTRLHERSIAGYTIVNPNS